MSKVVIGTWPLSGDFGPVSLSQVENTLKKSVDLGFKDFDTAPNYGNGFVEFAIGKVFNNQQDVNINSKCGNLPFTGKSFDLIDLQKSVDQSLMRLNRDHLNILYLHNPRTEILDYAPYIEFMNKLKKAGKIKYSGLSLAKGTDYENHILQSFDFLQNDINLLYQKPLKQEKAILQKTFARSPLASGILSGSLNLDSTFSKQDQRQSWLKNERLASILKRTKKIEAISDRPLDQLARKFLLQESDLSGVIFGVKRPEHLDSILNDLNSIEISEEIIKILKYEYDNDFGLTNESHLSF